MPAPPRDDPPFGPVQFRVIGSVAVLVLSHPPVNTLSAAMRGALAAAIARAAEDRTVRAVVITGTARMFSAGADIAEVGAVPAQPALPDLCTQIEAMDKPVVAALRGAVLGGGLELALAAHYRLAHVGARLGFPEISLGLLPGAGGTQRLPRLIGAEQALRMMLQGRAVGAAQALAMGLLDRVVETRLLPVALQFAAGGAAPRRTMAQRQGLRDAQAYLAAVARARAAERGNPLAAAGRIIDCVEAVHLLPEPQALALERHAFQELAASDESRALRYLFGAERRAAAPPAAVAAQKAARPARLGVVGASVESADLVARALAAGLTVTLADPSRTAMTAALQRVAEAAEAEVVAGRLTPEARDADWARLTSVLVGVVPGGVDVSVTAGEAGEGRIGLGGAPAAAGVALALAPRAGGGIEVGVGRGASAGLVAAALALARRLRGPVVLTGPGGPVAARLGAALDAAFALWRAQGTPAEVLDALQKAFSAVADPEVASRGRGLALLRQTRAALADAGARMVADEVVRQPSDIDCVAVQGGLMPRWSGGPMYQADRRGLLLVRADLHAMGATPAPLIERLIAEGRRFEALNRASAQQDARDDRHQPQGGHPERREVEGHNPL